MNMFSRLTTSDHATGQVHTARAAAQVMFVLVFVLALLARAGGVGAVELHERFAAYDAQSAQKVDHSAWNRLLKTYLHTSKDGLNRFDYAALNAGGMAGLNKYLSSLQSVDPAVLSRDEQFAFWTNLYNAKTVEIVAAHYPVRSIRDIKLSGVFIRGPWREKLLTVSGVRLSLDNIEHDIMRPIWRDPRVHYAANCASVGCPNLLMRAYSGASLEKMLDQAARAYINSPRGVSFNGSRVVVSSLYKWYAADFGGSVESVLAHLRKYAEPALAKRIAGVTRFSGYEYDWTLNDKQ